MATDPRLAVSQFRRESPSTRLDSWKEIASYLHRHVTTVRRWEKQEGLPVHRHLHGKLGSIYADSRELDAWLLTRQPGQDQTSDQRTATSPVDAPIGLPPSPWLLVLGSSPIDLVGREAEIGRLDEAWAAARSGRPQLVLVTGEPGIGKTRLALEFARSISTQATVLVGRCDREALVPYAPFVEVLQWVARATPPKILQAQLAQIDGSVELGQLVPELARRAHLTRDAVSATAEGHRYRLFEGLVQLLGSLSRSRPVLMLIEDIHWADRETMLLLRHLVRSTRDMAVCLVATCSEPELARTASSIAVLADLRREPSTTRVVLHGLPEPDVRSFINNWVEGDAPFALTRAVAEYSEGNPLFMSEILRHLTNTGMLTQVDAPAGKATFAQLGLPDGVRELIHRRLSRLSEAASHCLTLAAVVGREFSLSIVEQLADLTEESVLDALDEAVAAKVVAEVPTIPGRFLFTHVLIRETLYNQTTAARRVRLHRRVAEAIERQSEPDRLRLAQLAYHFSQAAAYGTAEKAVDYAVRAGDHAGTTLAPEEAARYYGMALDALAFVAESAQRTELRGNLHRWRGRSFFQVGQWAAAKTEFDLALSFLVPGQEAERCALLVHLAEASFWLMDVPGIRQYAGEAQVLADRTGRDDLWADATAWLASAMVADGEVLGGIAIDHQALARVGGIRSFGLARTPLTLYWAGRTTEAVTQATEAVDYARTVQDPAFLLYALQHWGLSLSGAGQYDDALRAFDEARRFGVQCGALPLLARATSMSVAPLLSVGDLDHAATRALEARDLAHRVAFEPPLVSAGIDLLLIYARLGEPGRADQLLHEVGHAAQDAAGWHGWKWRMRLWQARAELALARGDWTDALIAAGHVVDQSRPRHRLKYEALGLATRARAHGSRRLREALVDVRAATEVARRLADPAVLLTCLTVWLELDGNDTVLAEARQTVQRMLCGLPHGPLRRRFLTSVSDQVGASV